MAKEPIIKIFLSYHKECEVLKSEIMTPIHVGAALSNVHLDMQRDDEGINISSLNKRLCETTAQYWAWKNVDADYYGFMHYRRHFAFKDIPYYPDDGGLTYFDRIDEEYKKLLGLDDESIRKAVGDYDIILTPLVDTSSWGSMSNEVQFSSLGNLHARDFDLVLKVVTDNYPKYKDAVEEFRTGHYAYWYNMFVMKREIFKPYCEWLFDILLKSDTLIDYSEYDSAESRTLAFMAERLLSIYLIKLFKDKPELKVKHLTMTFVANSDKLSTVSDTKAAASGNYVFPIYKDAVIRAYEEMQSVKLPEYVSEMFETKENELKKLLDFKHIIFYGAGNWCRQFLAYFEELGIKMPDMIWDQKADGSVNEHGVHVLKPDFSSIDEDTLVIITIRSHTISDEVKKYLEENGVRHILKQDVLQDVISRTLWSYVAQN